MKIVLLSHGNLAQSFYETTIMIYGHVDDLSYVNLTSDLHTEDYQLLIEKELKPASEVLIIVDMLGGTPFIVASNILRKYNGNKHIDIITGLNLPMLLELLPHLGDIPIDQMKYTALQVGKNGIVDFREIIK